MLSVKAKPSLDYRIGRASYLAALARVSLDIFAFLKWQNNLDEYWDVLIPRWDFFRFVRASTEDEFMSRIANLFTSDRRTINFPRLLQEAEKTGVIDAGVCASIKSQIDNSVSIYKAVKMIRDNATSHQSDSHERPAVYTAAQVTLPKLIDLSDQSIDIAKSLCLARGIRADDIYEKPVSDLKNMLIALRAKGD